MPVQVGGGVRDEAQIDRLLDAGATWVVVGTRAIEDEDWRAEMALAFPAGSSSPPTCASGRS